MLGETIVEKLLWKTPYRKPALREGRMGACQLPLVHEARFSVNSSSLRTCHCFQFKQPCSQFKKFIKKKKTSCGVLQSRIDMLILILRSSELYISKDAPKGLRFSCLFYKLLLYFILIFPRTQGMRFSIVCTVKIKLVFKPHNEAVLLFK